jgi:ribosome-binding factor A
MPREFSRSARVGQQIQRELGELLAREAADPRLHGVTVSAVEVSRDLAHAKVYVTFLDPGEDRQAALKALHHAGGYLRTELAHRMRMRVMPHLRFLHDDTQERGDRLDALIDRAVAGGRDPHSGES